MAAGFRIYRKLAPASWFNSVGADEYYHLYLTEILGPLDPRAVAADLIDLAGDKMPVLLCYERVEVGQWCHRAMAAQWLAEALSEAVPEVGFETLLQADHPLTPPIGRGR
jgi:hypothetical protein